MCTTPGCRGVTTPSSVVIQGLQPKNPEQWQAICWAVQEFYGEAPARPQGKQHAVAYDMESADKNAFTVVVWRDGLGRLQIMLRPTDSTTQG